MVLADGICIPAVTVLTGGILKGRPGVRVMNRTTEKVWRDSGCIRLSVTPNIEVVGGQILTPDLRPGETVEDLKSAGIRQPRQVTGEEGVSGEHNSNRPVLQVSREDHYPKNLVPELKAVYDLIPETRQREAKRVIDEHFPKKLSIKN
jgi:hypothetical protein